jgi:hypothetical protein
MPLLALYAVILPSVACAVAYLLRRFPVPGTSRYALAAVGVAFAAALSVTLLVPLDMYWLYAPGGTGAGGVMQHPSKEASSARHALAIAWNLSYWSTVAATVLLPLLQVRRRWQRAALPAIACLRKPRLISGELLTRCCCCAPGILCVL